VSNYKKQNLSINWLNNSENEFAIVLILHKDEGIAREATRGERGINTASKPTRKAQVAFSCDSKVSQACEKRQRWAT